LVDIGLTAVKLALPASRAHSLKSALCRTLRSSARQRLAVQACAALCSNLPGLARSWLVRWQTKSASLHALALSAFQSQNDKRS
jgi:hypothetical protein